MTQIVALLGLFFCLAACSNSAEPDAEFTSSPDRIFYDYQVWAEEGRKEVTVKLQFRQGGEEGEPIALEEPSKVLLDETVLSADSTKFMGAYYEVIMHAEEFEGKHTIVYVDKEKEKHREEFAYRPFTLAKELPERIRKKPFKIQLKNFPVEPTMVRLVMTDTSHFTDDVNDELTIQHGLIQITKEQLANLSEGPVTLEIFREEEKPIGGSKKDGGKFGLTYGLRRQFDLGN